MELATIFSRKVLLPRLRRFLQQQQLLVFIGVIIYALFAALKISLSFVLLMVMILSVGNVMYPVNFAFAPLYSRRSFPWNWVIFLPLTFVAGLMSAFLAAVLLRWLAPIKVAFWAFFWESAPIAVVICLAACTIAYLAAQIQEKLQEKNRQLQQAVEKGTIALQKQEQELDRAREIQQDLMPKELPQLPRVELAGAWQPARTVGGDYFDVIQLDASRLGICIGDVAGKGITAALLMANLQASFRAFATPEESPAAVCTKLNAFLCGNLAPGKFVTFFYAILNAEDRTLRYENAGHCPAILLRANGETELLSGDGAVLGVLPDWQYKDFAVQLAPGDRLLLFTDGVTEAANAEFEEFGNARIIQSLRVTDETVTALATQRRILETVTRFCSSNFHDDATILVAAIR
ncbi:MAG TPA: SpoIIE family protein phosphatase [Candidatus Acidoferrum sp.]|nr:SpoIIE family protein phosphatase [Candidatus Acidoferrum sp.]